MARPALALLLFSVPLASVAGQERKLAFEQVVKKIEARFEPAEARPGQTVTLKIGVELLADWHTYPTVQPDPRAKNQTNRLILPSREPGRKSDEIIFVGSVIDPQKFELLPASELPADVSQIREYPGGATWEQKAVVSPEASSGAKTVNFKFRMLVCQKTCFPPRNVPVEATLVVSGDRVEVEPAYREEVARALGKASSPPLPLPAPPGPARTVPLAKAEPAGPPRAEPGAKSKPERPTSSEAKADGPVRIQVTRNYEADLDSVAAVLDKSGLAPAGVGADAGSFIAFLLTAMFWGGVTLLTPCVFPMIPITVSFFLKQGEKKHHNPLAMASLYTATIVVVLGISAITLLSVFRSLSVDPWMNLFLGGLFVFFALSLFGMYDIVLPSSLVRFTSAREGRGDAAGTVFMALSFTIVSFTCVAPFLGGFSGMAASGNFSKLQLAIGGLVFAATFAAPFFFLALFPSMMKKLPKSGSWLNTVKVVMGFLELAAALKFFRTAELRWQLPPAIFSYDLVLAMWVAILFLMGLYLFNLYRLPHDEPQEHIGVPRLLFGLMAVSIGVYLVPAVFSSGGEKPRPGGIVYAWVDSFLLPDQGKDDFVWSGDLKAAIEEARKKGEHVFIDFTGITCTNCRLNEKNVFTRPDVHDLLKRYRLVQMYTDTVPGELYESMPDRAQQEDNAEANLQFQKKYFGTEQLPLYAILRPEPASDRVAVEAVYDEGKINNEARFVQFLKQPFKADTARAEAR